MKLLLPQATNTYFAECECDFHFVFSLNSISLVRRRVNPGFFGTKCFLYFHSNHRNIQRNITTFCRSRDAPTQLNYKSNHLTMN